jgi:hypothetical protein
MTGLGVRRCEKKIVRYVDCADTRSTYKYISSAALTPELREQEERLRTQIEAQR